MSRIGVEGAYWRGADIDLRNPDTFDVVEPAGWGPSGIWLKTSQADLHIFSWMEGNGLGCQAAKCQEALASLRLVMGRHRDVRRS
jgi:hypothetical protein